MLANSGSGLEYVAAPAAVQNYPRWGLAAGPGACALLYPHCLAPRMGTNCFNGSGAITEVQRNNNTSLVHGGV